MDRQLIIERLVKIAGGIERGGIEKIAEDSFYNELAKIAACDLSFQKTFGNSLLFHKLAEVALADPELFELWKEAGLWGNIAGGAKALAGGAKNAYQGAQVGLGSFMAGHGGHAAEHGLHKFMTTESPTKALMAYAAHNPKAITQGAKAMGRGAMGAARKAGAGIQQGLQATRNAIMPIPGLTPAAI